MQRRSSNGVELYKKKRKLNKAYIEKIYSFDQPPKFTQKDLPSDVEFKATTYYSSNDDEDPDKGGQKILSKKGRKKEEPEEEEKEEGFNKLKFPFLYSGQPKDEDDYPDEGG